MNYFLIISLALTILTDGIYAQMSNNVVGAVYTMSNGALMNQVIINKLYSNGQLMMVKAVNTNGTGVNTTMADALFSQGAMRIYSNCLFVVNPGSNSLSLFMIDEFNATNLILVSVQPVKGSYPISIAVNKMYACVLTGGESTGLRCFMYNSSGLYLMPSFDRDLTAYVSQQLPLSTPHGTFSEILFSADNKALIISTKGYNDTKPGYVLFFPLSSSNTLAMEPIKQMPTNGTLPFSMTLVNMDGLLITNPNPNGVLTMNYASMNGTISNAMFTPINASVAAALCWSTYSPMTKNYYVIGANPGAIIELNVNLSSMTQPVKIVQYYVLPNNPGALDATVASISGMDYLFVIGITSQVISTYRLNGPGSATYVDLVTIQPNSNSSIPKIVGIAAFIQTSSSISALTQPAHVIILFHLIFVAFLKPTSSR